MLIRSLPLLILTIILSACSSNPVGLSDKQWEQLSPADRKELLLREQQIQAERDRIQQHADNEARKLQLQKEIAEEQRLQQLYQNAGNGNVIRMNIIGGKMLRDKQHLQIQPQSYLLGRGESQRITITLRDMKTGRDREMTAYLHYRIDGAGVELHLNYQNSSDQLRFLANGKWDCGNHSKQSLRLNTKEQISLQVYIEEMGRKPKYCGRHR